jgi:hypothetical protein
VSDPYFKPHVGQKVKLNAAGFRELRLDSEEAFEQARDMTITAFENINEGANWAEPIWVVQVDKPLINRFLLDT